MMWILGTRTTSTLVAGWIPPANCFDGFIENQFHNKTELNGHRVVWVGDVEQLLAARRYLRLRAVCGIASCFHRKVYVESLRNASMYDWGRVIHTTAVMQSGRFGPGLMVGPLSVVDNNTVLGKHCFVNRGVMVGHDNLVGDFVTFSPGCNVAGCCTIGNGVYVGMDATIVDRVSIGDNSFVAAGSVVVNDVPPNTAVCGVPAKRMAVHSESRILDRVDASRYELSE